MFSLLNTQPLLNLRPAGRGRSVREEAMPVRARGEQGFALGDEPGVTLALAQEPDG